MDGRERGKEVEREGRRNEGRKHGCMNRWIDGQTED